MASTCGCVLKGQQLWFMPCFWFICVETGGCWQNVPNHHLISRENSYSRPKAGAQAFLQWYSLFMCGKVLREGGAGSPLHMFDGAVVSNKSKRQTKAWHWILEAWDRGCSTCRCHTCPGFLLCSVGQSSTAFVGPHHCSSLAVLSDECIFSLFTLFCWSAAV